MQASYNPSSGAPKLLPRNPGYGKKRKAKEKKKKENTEIASGTRILRRGSLHVPGVKSRRWFH
jgi:hypothetical protein